MIVVRWLLFLSAAVVPLRGAITPSNIIPPSQRVETAAEVPTVSFQVPDYALTSLERETVAACLVLEAASQGDAGMRGVMAVIRNRSRGLTELFSPTVLRPKQFSALNSVTAGRGKLSDAVKRAKADRMWPTALRIVDEACGERWYDPTQGATHYTRASERIYWTRSLARTVTIGEHSFYR